MSKPLTMTVEQEKADRAASRFMDRCGMAEAGSADAAALRAWTEVDALRAALAAAEDDALHWRAYAEAADIKLADERRHADALVEALTKFMWAASPEQHGGTSAYPYEELRDLLAAHAARRAAAAPLSDAGASSEVANG